MQKRFSLWAALSLLSVSVMLVYAQAQTKKNSQPADKINVSGAWDFNVETPQGSGHPKVAFVQDGEKITGTYKGMFGESKVNGTLKGDTLQFSTTVNAQGTDLIISYSGRLEKDTLKGTVKFGDLGDGTWTATRAKSQDAKKDTPKKE